MNLLLFSKHNKVRFIIFFFFLAREAGLLARLRHPNIVSLYKVIDTGTTVVLLLELITGGELFHWTPSGETEAAHVVFKNILQSLKLQLLLLSSCYFYISIYLFSLRYAKF